MEEWNQKGIEDWKQNMLLKKEREAAQLEFEYRQAEKYNELAVTKLENANAEVTEGISRFEETLQAKGISPKVTKTQSDMAITQSFTGTKVKGLSASDRANQTLHTGLNKSLQTKTGGFTLKSTGLKHRTKQTFTDESRKTRDKRRKRLVTSQFEVFDDLDRGLREAQVVDLMKYKSN